MYHFKKLVPFLIAVAVGVSAQAEEAPMQVSGAETVTAQAAKSLFDQGAKFVDPRKDSDWEAGRIPWAIHLELRNAFTEQALAEAVDKAEKVVFYCNGPACLRSSEAAVKAIEWGYQSVYYFRDGFPAWKAAGYPIE